jgi:hypothetical protein
MEKVLTLDELANYYKTDKGTIWPGHGIAHGYAPIYESYLAPFRDKNIRLLEIGVCMEYTEGTHSLKMWNAYFKEAFIYAFDIVDISNHPCIIDNDNVFFYQGDQGNRTDLTLMYEKFSSTDFDFIVEDGSHTHVHQIISLGHLFKYVKSGGYYILEDMSLPDADHSKVPIRNDETYKTVKIFQETGKINSVYLTLEEKNYLEENVKCIEIYPDCQDTYSVAILTKK